MHLGALTGGPPLAAAGPNVRGVRRRRPVDTHALPIKEEGFGF
jgi:hypothetical protein